MKKKILSLFVLLVVCNLCLMSQDTPRNKRFIKDKVNIKLNIGKFKHKGNTASDPKQICFMGEVNYGFTEYLDAGVFCDFFRVKHYTEISEGNVSLKSYYNCFDYGLNANFHILPLFIDPSFSIVDVYVTPKIGLRTICDKQVDYLSTGLY